MKHGTKFLVFVLAGLPADVWAQSSNHVTPDASPLLWRDGYVNWRGKLVKPNWQMMSADDNTKFAIDLSKKPAHYAAAYIIDGETFNKSSPSATSGHGRSSAAVGGAGHGRAAA